MTSVPMQAIPRPTPDDNSDKRVTEPLVDEFQCVDKRVGPWLVGLLRGLLGLARSCRSARVRGEVPISIAYRELERRIERSVTFDPCLTAAAGFGCARFVLRVLPDYHDFLKRAAKGEQKTHCATKLDMSLAIHGAARGAAQ